MPDLDYKNQIEAILFASGRIMDVDTLINLLGASSKQVVKNNIDKLMAEYEERGSPLMIVEEKEGWKLTVREQYLGLVRKIVADIELPKTILETLAVIAWQAPVLQSKVVDIRHNKAYDHIKELQELGFIAKERQGRSYLLKLSNKFFDYFEVDGKKGIRELFKEIKEPETKTVEEFEDEQLGGSEGEEDPDMEIVKDLEVYEGSSDVPAASEGSGEQIESEHLGTLEVYDEDASSDALETVDTGATDEDEKPFEPEIEDSDDEADDPTEVNDEFPEKEDEEKETDFSASEELDEHPLTPNQNEDEEKEKEVSPELESDF